MGKASAAKQDTAKQNSGRRARIAAQRAAAQRARTRNRVLIAGGAIAVVVVVVLVLVLTGRNSPAGGGSGPGTPPAGSALTSLVTTTTTVPAATLDQIGAGQVSTPPMSISGSPLTSGGKPELLYIGAEYCPYCAAERWAMIMALSRFGTFSGLAATHSAAKNGAGQAELYPNTPTWTFAHASYASKYLTFTPVETYTNVPDPATGGYTTLQTPTAEQQALLTKYDTAYGGAIPFLDFGNKYLSVGASYDPGVLAGKTWAQVAADLHDPSSSVAAAAGGTANYLTAAICGITHDQPASACTSVVKALQAKI
jgi:thiol-disulfide isomerase/thioredoxin